MMQQTVMARCPNSRAMPLEACRLHFEVGDRTSFISETLYLLIEVGVGKLKPYLATLGSVEAYRSYGIAALHVIPADTLHKRGIGINRIWSRPEAVPPGMGRELALESRSQTLSRSA